MNKWIAEFELEDGDTMPEHMDLEYKGVRIDFHCKPQEPTPKNDLGVDCISREQAKAAIRDKFKDLPSRVEINTILNELPSVTPQEPKTGHWIRVDKDKLKCSKCEVTHFIAQYPHGCIDWCPNCGAKMVAPQESEDKE